jgi:hypothetical protein
MGVEKHFLLGFNILVLGHGPEPVGTIIMPVVKKMVGTHENDT